MESLFSTLILALLLAICTNALAQVEQKIAEIKQQKGISPEYLVALSETEGLSENQKTAIKQLAKEMLTQQKKKATQKTATDTALKNAINAEFKKYTAPQFANVGLDRFLGVASNATTPSAKAGILLAAANKATQDNNVDQLRDIFGKLDQVTEVSKSQLLEYLTYFCGKFTLVPKQGVNRTQITENRVKIIQFLLEKIWNAYAEENFALAVKTANMANVFANGKSGQVIALRQSFYLSGKGHTELLQRVKKELARANEFQGLYRASVASFDATGNATTPGALYNRGLYLITTRGDWDAAIRLFSISNNVVLKTAATTEFSSDANNLQRGGA